MKHINNGFAYITDGNGTVFSVSWQVQVGLDGVEVTHFQKKEVRHPELPPLGLADRIIEASNG